MLKPQDIVVLLKIKSLNGKWIYKDLAQSLGMSSSEVHAALKRCEESSLYINRSRRVLKSALKEFIIHGLRYSFPAKPGGLVKGIPTAHSADPLKSLLVVNDDDIYVWPSSDGQVRGQAIKPLHHSVPQATQNDPLLYQLLSLVDGLRVGKARDSELAIQELDKIMSL